MNLEYGARYEAFRQEVRDFLAESWPPPCDETGLPAREQEARFRDRATERGYLYRSIPRRYGGSEQALDVFAEEVVAEEFEAANAPWRLPSQGVSMLVPTLLECGSEEQRERFIRRTLRGDIRWCQGYSEPGAGSDLASVRSSGRLEGDQWLIDGHKIWTSDAQDADYLFGLFRTEPDAPRHAGISYLMMELRQPGIDVRPLRQIDGGVHFSEVFFDGARTPADWIVGGRGEGWRVGRVTLKYERTMSGGVFLRRTVSSLLELARRSTRGGRPALEDPSVRQRLAEIECYTRCAETSRMRRLSAIAHGEEQKAALVTLTNKLYTTGVHDRIVRLAYDLLGPQGLLAPTAEDMATPGVHSGTDTGWVDRFLFSLAGPIAAGASNIQRNIIGERGLGLPRDLRAQR